MLEVTDDGVKVTFLKRQRGSDNLFVYPNVKDIDTVESECIVDTLVKQPVMNNRQQFSVTYNKFSLS